MTLSEEFQYPAPCLPVSVKRIFKLTCATLFALLVVYLAALSAYSHHQVDSMHMAELVAQHREEWIANHNARELKRQIDANNL